MDRLKKKVHSEKGDATLISCTVIIFVVLMIVTICTMISVNQYSDMCKPYSDLPLSEVPAKCQSYYQRSGGTTTTLLPMIARR